MKRKIFIIMIYFILVLSFGLSVEAASARIVTTGPTSYIQPTNISDDRHHFFGTFQIGLNLTSIEGTAGISHLRIRITYDSNILTNYGGAFYNLPSGIGWSPSAGISAEYITIGDTYYYEGKPHLTNNTHFYAVNLKPNENVTGATTIRFDVIDAIDAEGNSISVGSTSHTVTIGSASANTITENSPTPNVNENSNNNASNANN